MKLTESEWQIMNVLWEHHPASARDLTERLPEENSWAYTTIKTMLSRLVAKTAVSERKKGNTSIYEPLVTRQKARRSALAALMNQAFEFTTIFFQFPFGLFAIVDDPQRAHHSFRCTVGITQQARADGAMQQGVILVFEIDFEI